MDWSNVTDTRNDQDTAWKLFEDTVANICCKHAPSHTRGMEASAKSSIPRPRRELLRKKRRLNGHINAIKYCSRTPRNNTKLEQLNKERATIELLLKDNIKRERLLQEVAAISKIKKNPTAFFTFAKKSAKFRSSVGPLVDGDNKLESDPARMGDILQQQYKRAFSNPNNVETTSSYISRRPSL